MISYPENSSWYVQWIKPKLDKKLDACIEKHGITAYSTIQNQVFQRADRRWRVKLQVLNTSFIEKIEARTRDIIVDFYSLLSTLRAEPCPIKVSYTEIRQLKEIPSGKELTEFIPPTFTKGRGLNIGKEFLNGSISEIRKQNKNKLILTIPGYG